MECFRRGPNSRLSPSGGAVGAAGKKPVLSRAFFPPRRQRRPRARGAICLPPAPGDPRNGGLLARSREIAALLRFPFVAASGVSSGAGAPALVMTCIDVKGVSAFAVVQRPREIGIRMALGATPLSVPRSIVAGSAPQVALGIAPGIRVCFALSKIAAAHLPALRAIRIDPIAALRRDQAGGRYPGETACATDWSTSELRYPARG